MSLKKTSAFYMDKEIHHNLWNLSLVGKHVGDKPEAYSMSCILDNAVREYFHNHKDEINELIEKYHALGKHTDFTLEDLK